MGYFDIGLTLGLFFYGVIIAALTFNSKFKIWFYDELFEDTFLGEAGKYLFFPDKDDEISTLDAIISVLVLILIHFLLFLGWIIIWILTGGILSPFLLLSAVVGPIIYYNSKRKKLKTETEESEEEETV
jgi:fatty acid desaturase